MANYRLAGGIWQTAEVFQAASVWLKELGGSDGEAGWDYMAGRSWINGLCYPAEVSFSSAEDYLAFKIKFPELLL